MTEVVILKM